MIISSGVMVGIKTDLITSQTCQRYIVTRVKMNWRNCTDSGKCHTNNHLTNILQSYNKKKAAGKNVKTQNEFLVWPEEYTNYSSKKTTYHLTKQWKSAELLNSPTNKLNNIVQCDPFNFINSRVGQCHVTVLLMELVVFSLHLTKLIQVSLYP